MTRDELIALAKHYSESSQVIHDKVKEISWAFLEADAERERLRDAVADGLELFDNYGFADESPCARDREIIATMREAIGKQPAGTPFAEQLLAQIRPEIMESMIDAEQERLRALYASMEESAKN